MIKRGNVIRKYLIVKNTILVNEHVFVKRTFTLMKINKHVNDAPHLLMNVQNVIYLDNVWIVREN